MRCGLLDPDVCGTRCLATSCNQHQPLDADFYLQGMGSDMAIKQEIEIHPQFEDMPSVGEAQERVFRMAKSDLSAVIEGEPGKRVPRRFPTLHAEQFAILAVEGLTGIVLSIEGHRAIADEAVYRVCNSIEEARQMAVRLVEENPHWESWIYDCNANVVDSHRNEEALVQAARGQSKPTWWSRLFGSDPLQNRRRR